MPRGPHPPPPPAPGAPKELPEGEGGRPSSRCGPAGRCGDGDAVVLAPAAAVAATEDDDDDVEEDEDGEKACCRGAPLPPCRSLRVTTLAPPLTEAMPRMACRRLASAAAAASSRVSWSSSQRYSCDATWGEGRRCAGVGVQGEKHDGE